MMTGLMNGQEVGTFLRNAAVAKVSAAPMELFAKAILCNICVCLAVWCSIKMKTETGKIMMAILGVMTFVTSGYEHSVANMTFFTIGLLDPGTAITIGGSALQSSDRHSRQYAGRYSVCGIAILFDPEKGLK